MGRNSPRSRTDVRGRTKIMRRGTWITEEVMLCERFRLQGKAIGALSKDGGM